MTGMPTLLLPKNMSRYDRTMMEQHGTVFLDMDRDNMMLTRLPNMWTIRVVHSSNPHYQYLYDEKNRVRARLNIHPGDIEKCYFYFLLLLADET